MKSAFITLILLLLSAEAFAQNRKEDSAQVAKVLQELLYLCKHVDFNDPKTTQLGTFYKAAPYIVYRGEGSPARRWKDFANYSNPEEKQGVDEVCTRINNTVNLDESYRFLNYHTEKESEGVWHAITIVYKKKGEERKALFAFLFIKGRYALGDID